MISILQITEGALLMEGEREILNGTDIKYFELFPERNYKQGTFFSNNSDCSSYFILCMK